MGVRARVGLGVLVLVLLSTFVVVPSSDAAKSPCDDCGNSCWMDYQPGWPDCGGPSGGCLRITIC